MNSKIHAVCFLVLLVSCEVFSRNLDERNFYAVGNENYENFDSGNDFVQYDIILTNDGGLKEDVADLRHPEIVDQPTKKKLRTNEKGLCVGSVMLMAMCY